MTCDYCSIDRVTHYTALTWLSHRRHLCEACAGEHGVVCHRPRRMRPPARDGPGDRQRVLLPVRQT